MLLLLPARQRIRKLLRQLEPSPLEAGECQELLQGAAHQTLQSSSASEILADGISARISALPLQAQSILSNQIETFRAD